MKTTFSVIIPHYNSPLLLQRCLDSIPLREDIEVIVVDDNSSPEKVDFDHFPGATRKHTRIIFNKDSRGAGHARNLGVKQASGKWLLFADADDFFTPKAWSLFDAHIDAPQDILYFGVTSVDSDTLQPTERYHLYDKYVQAYAADPTAENENWLRYRHDVPWGKMIRHELVINYHILFGETRYCNDTLFSCNCALAAKTVTAISEAAYCVTDTEASLTKQQSPEAVLIRFSVICQKNVLLRQHGLSQYQMPVLYFVRQALAISPKTACRLIAIGNKYKCPWGKEIKRRICHTPVK